jgi:hypothetical protein
MPVWVYIAVAAANIVASVGLALWASRNGANRAAEKAIAVYGEQIHALREEVVRLRDAKHVHATRLTEHEAWLSVLKHRAGVE